MTAAEQEFAMRGLALLPVLSLSSAMLALSVPAQAAETFVGADDGSAIGGPNPNSDAAASAFLASAASYGSIFTLDFEGEPTGYSANYSFTGVNVTLAAPDFGPGFSGVTNITFGNLFGYDIDSGSGNWLGFPSGSAIFNFGSATNAFGFYSTGVQDVLGLVFNVSMNGADGQTFNLTPNVNGGAQYFGFTTADAFNMVTISRPGDDAWGIDRVSYNFNGAVPEASTWAMMLLGFGFVGGAMRSAKRRHKLSVSYA